MLKKILFITIGCLAIALGTLGIVLPLLPTVPFYVLALCVLPKGSERFARWFDNSKLCRGALAKYTRRGAKTTKNGT
ncbi:MAG: YbaN family protein [Oscillospiraceae bacterium]|jgi:uncharacterized membrane protein YbaN (DUF454 family)|nr:YbaN family protein [Oscillospiraceae bacterium]